MYREILVCIKVTSNKSYFILDLQGFIFIYSVDLDREGGSEPLGQDPESKTNLVNIDIENSKSIKN